MHPRLRAFPAGSEGPALAAAACGSGRFACAPARPSATRFGRDVSQRRSPHAVKWRPLHIPPPPGPRPPHHARFRTCPLAWGMPCAWAPHAPPPNHAPGLAKTGPKKHKRCLPRPTGREPAACVPHAAAWVSLLVLLHTTARAPTFGHPWVALRAGSDHCCSGR
ncbi:MAG: hypothetical protein J3K34DRAFT_435703 [Monoraphidium minutum]|nr:MAG: hypothetical protein J3K34DRAFT_435703 [Monoraphidium minutum]